MFAEVGGDPAVVGFGGLGGLVDAGDLFGGLADAHVDAFAGYVFEGVVVVATVRGFVQDHSVFGLVGQLQEVGLDYILRSFDFCVCKVIHPFTNYTT